MKITLTAFLFLSLLTMSARATPRHAEERAWKPFLVTFLAALKKRDRDALKEIMSRDFYCSPGVGDDNHDGDTRDDAFKFYNSLTYTDTWAALDKTMARGTVPLRERGDGRRRMPSRVAPPRPPSTTAGPSY